MHYFGGFAMNLRSLEYFVEVARELNMTTAARRSHISQQALSTQIRNLEKYYGVELFQRQPKLQLTRAGMCLLESAQRILQENTKAINNLSEISRTHAGILRLGIPASRAAVCFPQVLPEFVRHWPHILLRLEDVPSPERMGKVLDGTLDAAVITPQAQHLHGFQNRLEFTLLLHDSIYLICSDDLLQKSFGERASMIREKAEKGTDLKEFSQVPFLLHEFPERMRQIEEQCFYRAGFSPRIFMETRSTELRNILYGCQFGALFCRRSQVRSLRKKFPGCHAFPIIPAAGDWDDAVYFVRQKSSWTPAHVLEFEKLMQRAWKEIAQH